MTKKYFILSTIFMILITVFGSVSILAQGGDESTSGSKSEIGVETKMNGSKVPVNVTDVIKSLNFSCDINLNCFDKKNKVELVILANNTSTVKIPTPYCGDLELDTKGLLLIPYVNSSLSLEKLETSGIFLNRGCGISGSDMISGIYSGGGPVSMAHFFGQKNYIVPETIILTNATNEK